MLACRLRLNRTSWTLHIASCTAICQVQTNPRRGIGQLCGSHIFRCPSQMQSKLCQPMRTPCLSSWLALWLWGHSTQSRTQPWPANPFTGAKKCKMHRSCGYWGRYLLLLRMLITGMLPHLGLFAAATCMRAVKVRHGHVTHFGADKSGIVNDMSADH